MQEDIIAPPDTTLRFITIEAMDGFQVDAGLIRPNGKTPEHSKLIVSEHRAAAWHHAQGGAVRAVPPDNADN